MPNHSSLPSRECACGCRRLVKIDGMGSALSQIDESDEERPRIFFASLACQKRWQEEGRVVTKT